MEKLNSTFGGKKQNKNMGTKDWSEQKMLRLCPPELILGWDDWMEAKKKVKARHVLSWNYLQVMTGLSGSQGEGISQ